MKWLWWWVPSSSVYSAILCHWAPWVALQGKLDGAENIRSVVLAFLVVFFLWISSTFRIGCGCLECVWYALACISAWLHLKGVPLAPSKITLWGEPKCSKWGWAGDLLQKPLLVWMQTLVLVCSRHDICLRTKVAPGACQLHICKAQKHVSEPRESAGCLDAANCLVCLFFACGSAERGLFSFFVCKFWATQGIHGFWKAAPSTFDKATETYLWPLGKGCRCLAVSLCTLSA